MGLLEDAKEAMEGGINWEVRAKENEEREKKREAEERELGKVIESLREEETLKAIEHYTELGILTQLLKPPVPGDNKTGKSPLSSFKGYNIRQKPNHINFMKAELKKNPGANIGMLCGKVSDLTVLDIDWYCKPIIGYIFQGENKEFCRQAHTDKKNGKQHIIFKYTPLPTTYKGYLGFDILSQTATGGTNCVCYPSVHYTGEKYVMTAGFEDREKMSDGMVIRINHLIDTYAELKTVLGKCKSILQKFWVAVFEDNRHEYYRDTKLFRGMEGRNRHIALFADLKANGASNNVLHLVCMLIFGEGYEREHTDKEIRGISGSKTWQIKTLCKDPVFNEFNTAIAFDPETADFNEFEAKLDEEIRESMYDLMIKAPPEAMEAVRTAFLIGHYMR